MLLSDSQISMRPLCLNLLFTPIDCIDAKCLTECQSRLEMVRSSLGVSFWFISIVIMCLMDSGGCSKFWAVAEILGLKSALNLVDFGIGVLEIVLGRRYVGLWGHLELSGCFNAHRMGVSKGLKA